MKGVEVKRKGCTRYIRIGGVMEVNLTMINQYSQVRTPSLQLPGPILFTKQTTLITSTLTPGATTTYYCNPTAV